MSENVGKKSKKEMTAFFKEKEVLVGNEKIVVRQWSAYKFVKLIPRIQKIIEKVIGKSINMAGGDPQKIFDQLENLVVVNVVSNLAEVFAVAGEEAYGIVKETIDRDDAWMDTIPFDKMLVLAAAVVEVCLTKEVVKNVRSLLGNMFKKANKSPSEK